MQALQYLFRLIDIKGQGYLDAFTLNYFFRVCGRVCVCVCVYYCLYVCVCVLLACVCIKCNTSFSLLCYVCVSCVLLHSISQAIQEQMKIHGHEPVRFEDIKDEIFDMVKPANPLQLTLQDLNSRYA